MTPKNDPLEMSVALVHHTGTMIRFTTSQLGHLPKQDKGVTIALSDGTELACKFHRHPANPYIAGPQLVKWIKSWIPFRQKEQAIVREEKEGYYTLLLSSPLKKSKEENEELQKLLKRFRKASERPPEERRKKYDVIIRQRINSDLVKKCFGHKCQVENCEFLANVSEELYMFLSEVHHLEHLGVSGDNSPYNLAILCANHHAIFHRDKTAKVEKIEGDHMLISYNKGQKKVWIRRNLSLLYS